MNKRLKIAAMLLSGRNPFGIDASHVDKCLEIAGDLIAMHKRQKAERKVSKDENGLTMLVRDEAYSIHPDNWMAFISGSIILSVDFTDHLQRDLFNGMLTIARKKGISSWDVPKSFSCFYYFWDGVRLSGSLSPTKKSNLIHLNIKDFIL